MRSFIKFKKMLSVILLLVIITLLSTSCGFKDIDKRIFIIGVGVDKSDSEENPYRITLKMAAPSGNMKNSPAGIYLFDEKISDRF